jgi:formylglycine-generating enzyme required for sulfatase activity
MHASYKDGADCVGDGMPGCALTDLVAVGTKPSMGDGRWGQSDLAGNVLEWALDWFAAYQLPCVDCADITPSVSPSRPRVFRGGSFYGCATLLRTANRNHTTPENRDAGIGVRCARTP